MVAVQKLSTGQGYETAVMLRTGVINVGLTARARLEN